jgi:aquaporin Z
MAFQSKTKSRVQGQASLHLHWAEYGAEFLGTAFLVFVGLSAVVFDNSAYLPLSSLIPNTSVRLLITGLLFAGSGSLVAISPPGKLSGAHINPSFGAVLLVLFWGKYAHSVNNGMTLPGAGYPIWAVFLAELALTCLLVFAIFLFVSSRRLMRWTPLMNWILVAVMVWLEAPISGTSLNPARSIGPALVSDLWTAQWLYCIAPPLGGLLAVALFRLFTVGERDVLTGKLFHAPEYRSIFKNTKAPHRNQEEIA